MDQKLAWRKKIIAFVTILVGSNCCFAESHLEVGKRFPDLVLPSIDNPKAVSIHKGLGGKKTLLMIFAGW